MSFSFSEMRQVSTLDPALEHVIHGVVGHIDCRVHNRVDRATDGNRTTKSAALERAVNGVLSGRNNVVHSVADIHLAIDKATLEGAVNDVVHSRDGAIHGVANVNFTIHKTALEDTISSFLDRVHSVVNGLSNIDQAADQALPQHSVSNIGDQAVGSLLDVIDGVGLGIRVSSRLAMRYSMIVLPRHASRGHHPKLL